MKRLKINMKKFITRGALTFALLSTPATLGGCGKAEEKDPRYIRVDNQGIIEYDDTKNNADELTPIYYVNNEGFLKEFYIDEEDLDSYICSNPDDETIYQSVDAKVIDKFVEKQDLIDIEENLDALLEATKDNKIVFGREKYVNNFTGEEEYTGRYFLTVHYYQTYRIVIGKNGKPKLEEGPVLLDFTKFEEEYPYVKEDYDQTYSYDITQYKDVLVGLDETAVDIDVKSLGLTFPF